MGDMGCVVVMGAMGDIGDMVLCPLPCLQGYGGGKDQGQEGSSVYGRPKE